MNNLSEKYRASQALATFEHLNWLDDLWTQYLEETREIPDEDIQTLSSLTEGMQTLLKNSVREARWLQTLIAERGDQLNESLLGAPEQDPLSNEVRRELQARLNERGGFVAVAQTATEIIIREADEAREEIAAKMRRIRDGNFVPGDLPKSLKCALLAAGLATAVAAHQYPIAVAIGLHMSSIGCI